jgi:hypothetical protein
MMRPFAGAAVGDPIASALGAAAHRAAGGLGLWAAPTFAVMALTAALGGEGAAMVCPAPHGGALGGMAAMYALMAAFHLPPWLRRIANMARSR